MFDKIFKSKVGLFESRKNRSLKSQVLNFVQNNQIY